MILPKLVINESGSGKKFKPLSRPAVHYSALLWIIVYCSAVHGCEVYCCEVQCITVNYSAVQCVTVLYSEFTVKCSAVQCPYFARPSVTKWGHLAFQTDSQTVRKGEKLSLTRQVHHTNEAYLVVL